MIACSRPAPGPFTFTSTSTMPCLRASTAAFSAARPAAQGVLLRAPLMPAIVPADAQLIVSPLVSVMVTIVLLNVDLTCATPRVTPLRIFFFGPAARPPAFAAPPPPLPPAVVPVCSAMCFAFLLRIVRTTPYPRIDELNTSSLAAQVRPLIGRERLLA